jgi:hypothetical protein
MIGVICSPTDLPYRVQNVVVRGKQHIFREAADPSVVRFNERFGRGYRNVDSSWREYAQRTEPAQSLVGQGRRSRGGGLAKGGRPCLLH